MKLDGQNVIFHGSVNDKPIADNNGAVDSVRLGCDNELETKEQSGDFFKVKSRVGKADGFEYAVNDLKSDDEEKLRDFVAPLRFSGSLGELKSSEDSVLYVVDESVMEPELPDSVVCHKENAVKDMCIDDGTPSVFDDKTLTRSDSSTRSFAFPTLQSEWNSSPVRMAKGERRWTPKHGGWRQAIICCRF